MSVVHISCRRCPPFIFFFSKIIVPMSTQKEQIFRWKELDFVDMMVKAPFKGRYHNSESVKISWPLHLQDQRPNMDQAWHKASLCEGVLSLYNVSFLSQRIQTDCIYLWRFFLNKSADVITHISVTSWSSVGKRRWLSVSLLVGPTSWTTLAQQELHMLT